MRHIVIIAFFLLGITAQAQEKEIKVKTSAVCEMCKHTLEYDLTFAKGIKWVELDLDSKVLNVKYNEKKTDKDQILRRIQKLGYDADSLKKDSVAFTKLPFCCRLPGYGHTENHSGH